MFLGKEMKNTEHRMKNDKVGGIWDSGNKNIVFQNNVK